MEENQFNEDYPIQTPDESEPTKESAKRIAAVDSDTVQRICSGQVIISLAIAVKELVENSLDAGATIIEVKLKEHGLECVEVSDNGHGVEENDFNGMTSRYSTSKLREFTDLQNVETFGFRGEALNSLCALSDITIITRHKSAEIASKLELDHKGSIIKKALCSRQVGTTVILTNLFSTLPVRKKDYAKNIKKEFTKMCQILQAYCLVSTGVRIICTNQTSKGVRNTFISTNGSLNVRDNIQAVFGSKQVQELIQIKPALNENEKYFTKDNLCDVDQEGSSNGSEFIITSDDIDRLNQIAFKIDGWISSCNHGSGRSSRDRQFFFVNSRPCEPKNIIKLVNDIYHRYNQQQYPFVFLNIILNKSEIDVNLTPDKRKLLLNNEKLLLIILKKSLIRTFENIPSSYKIQTNKLNLSLKSEEISSVEADNNDDSNDAIKSIPISQKFKEKLMQWKATGDTEGPFKPARTIKRKTDDEITEFNAKLKKIQNILSQPASGSSTKTDSSEAEKFCSYTSGSDTDDDENENGLMKKKDNIPSREISKTNPKLCVSKLEAQSKAFDIITQRKKPNYSINVDNYSEKEIQATNNDNDDDFEKVIRRIDCKIKEIRSSSSPPLIFESKDTLIDDNNDNNDTDEDISEIVTILDSNDKDDNDEESAEQMKISGQIDITIDEIWKLALEEDKQQIKNNLRKNTNKYKFCAEINPNKSKKAEEELQRELSKDMFAKMDIIGQFNLGFIIVKLDNDLFIVDQHASDEKYNFETLQKTTNLHYQPLTVPQNLELTAVNEMILIDNLKMFERNGFKFQIDEAAPITKKVKLIGKPFSKNWEFGKSDIDELIFMLQDAPKDLICRPSRVRSMFASRACRKSVMIGKPLNQRIMRKLIDHLGKIDQPWNCPHGRPTIRHLVNLAMLDDDEDE